MEIDHKLIKPMFPLLYKFVTAHYGWFNGKNVEMCGTTMCHAGLRHHKRPTEAIVSEIISCASREQLGKETCSAYYNWLFNESPLSDAFIDKDADEVLADNFVIVSVDVPANMAITACIATRYLWEEFNTCKAWFDLVQAGVPKDVAFVLAHLTGNGYDGWDKPDRRSTIGYYTKNSNHSIFNGWISKGTLTNFIGRVTPHADKTSYRKVCSDTSYVGGIGSLFSNINQDKEYRTNKTEGLLKIIGDISRPIFEKIGLKEVEVDQGPWAEPRFKREPASTYQQVIEVFSEAWPIIVEKDKE